MKRILTLLATTLLCCNVFAQIDPTVEVSRHYKVNVADIERPQTTDNHVADSLQKFDVGFDYSIFDRPYTDLYEFTPYQTDSISKVVRRRPPVLMAQLGAQYPWAPEVMLRTQLVTRPRLNIGLDGDLKGAFTTLDYMGQENLLGVMHLNGAVSGNLKHSWNTGELTAVLNYKLDEYADAIGEDALAHIINSFELGFNIASANPADGSVFYNISFNYEEADKRLTGLTPVDTSYNNSRLSLKGTLGASFDRHRVYVDLKYQNAISGLDEQKVNVGLLEFMPMYEYARGPLKLRAGARFGNKYIGTDASTTIHPELDIKFELIKNTIWLRGLLSGGNELNSLVDYIHDAPWLCNGLDGQAAVASDAICVHNIETKISLESIVAGRFALSPYLAYSKYSNKIQLRTSFTDSGLPYLLPEYTNYAVTQWGVETSWKSKNLTINGHLLHNNPFTETGDSVYMVADWQVGGSLEFNIKRRLFLNASYTYESERESWGGVMPEYSDLNVVLTGVINRNLSIYLKGGNLLDNPNFRYFAIPELPRNIGGGIRINF
ncbi:MAG: hypothetical protein IJS30_07945 [Bacteroidales bacterium]|nr:hypothetical protein [Bacteroidales bacterium]